MTDQMRAPHPELVARVLPKGAAVILRDYEAPDRAYLATRLKSICSARGVKLMIGADPDLAMRIGAHGVHCPRWFNLVNPPPKSMVISAACHNDEELDRARGMGADLIFLSPVFETGSHQGGKALGATAFRDMAAQAPAPVLALGGVTAENAHRLSGVNVAGISAISAFLK
jgi:thiamine-phosphate pyrophosphorylase